MYPHGGVPPQRAEEVSGAAWARGTMANASAAIRALPRLMLAHPGPTTISFVLPPAKRDSSLAALASEPVSPPAKILGPSGPQTPPRKGWPLATARLTGGPAPSLAALGALASLARGHPCRECRFLGPTVLAWMGGPSKARDRAISRGRTTSRDSGEEDRPSFPGGAGGAAPCLRVGGETGSEASAASEESRFAAGKSYPHRGTFPCMGDDGDSKALLYVTIGALAAVGAGYLVWRYVLSDETKDRAKQAVRQAAEHAKQAASDATHRAREGFGQAKAAAASSARTAGARAAEAVERKARGVSERLRD